MPRHPAPIQNLIEYFANLPGIGPKTAERLVYFLIQREPHELNAFAQALTELPQGVTHCSRCHNFAQGDPCEICANSRRDVHTLCVVAKPQDVAALEKSGDYTGLYHVLGGTIDPLEGKTPDKLEIASLQQRLKTEPITEIILALSPDMPGETTILYLTKLLKEANVKLTRLARGLPMGSDLEYADEVTLSNAIKHRNQL